MKTSLRKKPHNVITNIYIKTITNKLLERKIICLYQYNIFKMKKIGSYNAYLLVSSRHLAIQFTIWIKSLYLYF